MSSGEPIAVCVLGPPRSGTSLTTRILNLIGVDLGGEENLNKPLPTSQLWESRAVIDLNERILNKLGGGGLAPPAPEPGWETSEEFAAEREEGRELIATMFGSSPLWGWKDPRTCVTLPLWQRLVPNLRYVVCLRDPLNAVASISRNTRISPQQMLRSWATYVASALDHTTDGPRTFASYEGYFAPGNSQVERLARFVGQPLPTPDSRAGRELRSIANERLWHVHASAAELEIQELPPEVRSLHETMVRLHGLEEEDG